MPSVTDYGGPRQYVRPLGYDRPYYDTDAAILTGHRGPVRWRYALYRADLDGTVGSLITDVTGGEVSVSNFRDHTWEVRIARREINKALLDTVGDHVMLFVGVRDADDATQWRWWPYGLYRVEEPAASHSVVGSDYGLVCRSPEVILAEDYATDGYLIPAGKGVLAAARDILTSHGVPTSRIDFPGQDVALVKPMWFDPHQDFSKCAYLRIANAALNAGGFYAIFTDAEGYFRTKTIEATDTRDPAVLYSDEGIHRFVVGDISEDFDWEAFANKVVVYSGDPSKGAMIDAVAVNRDPDSPGSVLPPPAGIGRVVMREPVVLQNLVSSDEAQRVARAHLKRASAVNHKLTINLLPDPRRGPREDVELDLRRVEYPDPDAWGPLDGQPGRVVVEGVWTVIGWTMPLNNPPEPMSMELSRRERLTA